MIAVYLFRNNLFWHQLYTGCTLVTYLKQILIGMKRTITFLFMALMLGSLTGFAQDENAAINMMNSASKLTIGGYGQIDYNQDFGQETSQNGKLDVHRMVMLFGYKFNDKTQFITELEMEHVKEIYVEQAFLDHRILPGLSFRAGLMLVPMGLTNLYHEPTSFFGVERPNIDSKIAPTTWREIGAGFAGAVQGISLKYELYVMNGFNGYNGGGKLRGVDGLRKGRQKGAESFMSSPTFAGRVSYYGLPGLQFGLSNYSGKTQSSMFHGLNTADTDAVAQADSSVVNVSMHGFDVRFTNSGIRAKAQVYYTNIKNTVAYNEFTGKDLGSQMFGYYVEVGYDVLNHTDSDYKLIPFVRYENYDTHRKTDGSLARNAAFNRTEITTGIGWYLSKGAVLKADLQFLGNESTTGFDKRVNFGVGVWF